jgi:hypothetical protein
MRCVSGQYAASSLAKEGSSGGEGTVHQLTQDSVPINDHPEQAAPSPIPEQQSTSYEQNEALKKPGRIRRIFFQGVKILFMPSFGGEVKPSKLNRREATLVFI